MQLDNNKWMFALLINCLEAFAIDVLKRICLMFNIKKTNSYDRKKNILKATHEINLLKSVRFRRNKINYNSGSPKHSDCTQVSRIFIATFQLSCVFHAGQLASSLWNKHIFCYFLLEWNVGFNLISVEDNALYWSCFSLAVVNYEVDI